ncbi:hypothetical protein [Mannheimia bovis]|uniref:Uncharacterized protein n=1 Tax=Mannheimia bovis TaxID=2770636 RepID=A0A7H1C571_9PAST|nr:hypothetical protein [Mannheimia bovis]QNS16126.1 hypothetical protein ICJ55_05215 [Mannheimia bovis]
MKKLITIALLALATTTTAHAKIGDTFIDPEFGKITVKGPAFPNDGKTQYEIVNSERKAIKTPEWNFVMKSARTYTLIEIALNKFLKQENKSESDIIKMTKIFIENLQTLKPMRKTIYLDGYNPEMLFQYDSQIKNIQRAFKYQFLDYFLKIEGNLNLTN